jgi:glycosyltransferase involved in cell wall biosynthesis
MVLLEAILANVPIIATNAGGAKEIIPNDDFLFEVADVNKLAKLTEKHYQLTETDKQTIIEQNRLHLLSHFTDEAVTKRFWELDFVQKITQLKV